MNFLGKLAARSTGALPLRPGNVQPRLPTLFEAAPSDSAPVESAPVVESTPRHEPVIEETQRRITRVEEVLRREIDVEREQRVDERPALPPGERTTIVREERIVAEKTREVASSPVIERTEVRIESPLASTPAAAPPQQFVVESPQRDGRPPRKEEPRTAATLASEVTRVLQTTIREREPERILIERQVAPPPRAAILSPAALAPPIIRREPVEVPPAPAIHVTIGRVDVRAVMQSPPATRAPTRAQPPALSLDDYLKQRERGSR